MYSGSAGSRFSSNGRLLSVTEFSIYILVFTVWSVAPLLALNPALYILFPLCPRRQAYKNVEVQSSLQRRKLCVWARATCILRPSSSRMQK